MISSLEKKDSRFQSIYFLNITQFLGALNDNIVKYLIVFFLIQVQGISNTNTILLWRAWANAYLTYSALRGPVRSTKRILKYGHADCDDMIRAGIDMLKPHGIKIVAYSQRNNQHFVGVTKIGEYYYDVINTNRHGLVPMTRYKDPSKFGKRTTWKPEISYFR